MSDIYIPKKRTQEELALAMIASTEVKGKKKGRVAGGWIADLCALKRVILLCSACTHKFNPGRLGYVREKELPIAQGTCDGCSTFDSRCSWYLWEETYKDARSTAEERRALQKSREKRIKRGDLNGPA